MGLIPMFTLASFFTGIDKFVKNKTNEITLALAYEGEKFVNEARERGDYHDITKNLRGSIAYDVVLNGKTLHSDYSGGESQGEESEYFAKKAVDDVINDNDMFQDNIIWLIGVAGMEYAAPLESKGWDVITNSVPEDSDIKDLLKDAGLT